MANFGYQSFNSSEEARDSQKFNAALIDFRRARREAALKAVLGRLQGTSLELLSYEEVAEQLQVTGQVERGVREIPLEKIVGSVGRYDEFDRSFLPLKDHDAQRWAGVRAAAVDPTTLPAIDVYQIGEAYFVIDGNHRVSIARHSGMDYLEANVIEIQTRVPLPEDLRHDELIVASEYAGFLEHTGLDWLRPDADLVTSLPGQYDKLENHIEVHRFFLEMSAERELTDEEAVLRWFDDAYLPVVEAIREYGLLRDFDERTETDLYLWIAENQAALRNELGWEVGPQTAAQQLPRDFVEGRQGRAGRLYRRVIQAVVPQEQEAAKTWSEQKILDRYSDRLFASILAITTSDHEEAAVAQAAIVAQLEKAHLLAIQAASAEGNEPSEAQMQSTREWFERTLGDAGVSGEIGFQQGELSEVIRRWVNLADLLVLDAALLADGRSGNDAISAFFNECTRPVLLVSGAPRPIERILLLFDGRPQANEALFVAAYMAEMWGCPVVLLSEPSAAAKALGKAAPYLEMHETPAESIIAGPLAPEPVMQTAAEHHSDLIIVGGYRSRPLSKTAVATWLLTAPEDLRRPLLICP